MDDSDNGSAEGESPGDIPAGSTSSARPQQPIGGMVRDPREVKTNPSLTRFLRERMSAALVSGLVAIGVLRPRTGAATGCRLGRTRGRLDPCAKAARQSGCPGGSHRAGKGRDPSPRDRTQIWYRRI